MASKKLTEEQEEAAAVEVLARKGDREWARAMHSTIIDGVKSGDADSARQRGRLAALATIIVPPAVRAPRRTKEEVAAEKDRKAKEKAAKEKAAKNAGK